MAILETKTPFLELTEKVKKFLNLDYIRYAIAKSHKNGEPVSKVAICVGSGRILKKKKKKNFLFYFILTLINILI